MKIEQILTFDYDEIRDKDILDAYSRIGLLMVNLDFPDEFEIKCGQKYRVIIEEV